MAKELNKIDDKSKEILLNQKSPSNDKEGDLSVKDTIKPAKSNVAPLSDNKGKSQSKPGVISLTEEELNKPVQDTTNTNIYEEGYLNALENDTIDPPTEDEKDTYSNPLLDPVTPENDYTDKEELEPIDFSLSPEEFDKKYNSNFQVVEGNESLVDSEVDFADTMSYGKGLEDYREYIHNPIKGKNLDYNRAVAQGNWNKFGNGNARFILNVIPEIVKQGANIVEAGINLFGKDTYGNPVSDYMTEMQTWVNDEFDIYLERPNEFLDVGDFAWWVDRGSSLATSVTAFLALGYATGGLGLASRGVSLLARTGARGTEIANFLRAIPMAGKTANLPKAIDALTGAVLLNQAESIGVGVEVFNETKDRMLQEYLHQGYSKEEAYKMANKEALRVADRAYMFNQLNIALNISSVVPFLRATRGTRTGFLKSKSLLKGGLKLAHESGQEAAEEWINFLSERFAKDDNYSFGKALADLGEDEAIEAMVLGAMGGIGQTGLTLSGQYIPSYKNGKWGESSYQKYKGRIAAQKEIKDYYDTLSKFEKQDFLDFFKSSKEHADIHVKKNNLTRDINDLYERISEASNSGDFTTAEKLQQDLENKNNELEELTKDLFINRARQAFDNGTATEFENTIKAVLNLSEEEATRLGVTEEHKEIFKQKLKEFKDLEVIYNKTKHLYKGNQAYEHKAQENYYKSRLETFEKEYGKNLQIFNDVLEKDFGINSGDYSIDEEGNFTLNLDDSNIKEIRANLRRKEDKLAILKVKESDTSIEEGVLEKEISELKSELLTQEENFAEERYKADTITDAISSLPMFSVVANKQNTIKNIKENIKQRKKAYDELVSRKGQAKAAQEIKTSREKLEAQLKKIQHQKKEAAKEAAKKTEENKEETKENKKETKENKKKTAKSEKSKNIIKEVKEKLKVLNEKTLIVSENNSNVYIDKDNPEITYDRVSTLTGKKSFTNNEAADRGTLIDTLLRQFIDGKIKSLEEFKKAYEDENLNESLPFSDTFIEKTYNTFKSLVENNPNMEFISTVRTLWGEIDGKRIAGTIDLLGIDTNTGKVFIIDLKTSTLNRVDRYNMTDDKYGYKNSDSIQQSAYAELLRQRTGISVNNIYLLPLQVNKSNDTYTDIQVNRQLDGSFFLPAIIDRSIFPKEETSPDNSKTSSTSNETSTIKENDDIISITEALISETPISRKAFDRIFRFKSVTIAEELYQVLTRGLISENGISTNYREKLIIGIIKSNFENPTTKDPDAQLLVNTLNTFNEINEDTSIYTVSQVIQSENSNLVLFEDFINIEEAKQKAIEISNFSPEISGDNDNEKAEAFKERLQTEEGAESKFEKLLNDILAKNNLTTKNSLKDVILGLQSVIGENLTREIFYKVRGFMSFKHGHAYNRSPYNTYDNLTSSKEERARKRKAQTIQNKSTRHEDFPSPTLEEINKVNIRNAKAELLMSGEYSEGDPQFEDIGSDENKIYTTAKSNSVADKAAYNVVEYRIVTKNGLTDRESTGNINEGFDSRLFLPEGIKEGDIVTFKLEEIFEDSNGTIYTTKKEKAADGNTILKTYKKPVGEPEVVEGLAVDYAPLAIYVNGEKLQGVYVHKPSWINRQNLTDIAYETSAAEELSKLKNLRQSILDGKEVVTRVKEVSKGHYLRTPNLESVSKNMPGVEVAMVQNSGLIRVEGAKEIDHEGFELINGTVVALIPEEGSNKVFPATLLNNGLDKRKIDTVKTLIKLKFYPEKDLSDIDKQNIEFLKSLGVNIRSNSKADYIAFSDLLNNFIHTNGNFRDIEISSVLSKFPSNQSVFYLKKEGSNGIKFLGGSGKTKGFNLFINGNQKPDKATVDAIISGMNIYLKKSLLNFNGSKINEQNFSLPLLKEDGELENEQYDSYVDFIKQNTKTKFKSVEIEGQHTYRVQKTIKYHLGEDITSNEISQQESVNNVEDKEVSDLFADFSPRDNDADNTSTLFSPEIVEYYKNNPNEINYSLKAVQILQSDKAEKVFAKGKKNNWDLNKILTELQIPKEQKQIILDKNINNKRKPSKKAFEKSIDNFNNDIKNLNKLLAITKTNDYKKAFDKLIDLSIAQGKDINKREQYLETLDFIDELKSSFDYLFDEDTSKNISDLIKETKNDKNKRELTYNQQAKIYNEDNLREEIITSLLADNSFTVEINTSEKNLKDDENAVEYDGYLYKKENGEIYSRKNYWNTGWVLFKNAEFILNDTGVFEKLESKENKTPTQYYSNLTVPGGTNYTENEIATPAITPSIKGHSRFATDNGIGWFRSDDKILEDTTDLEKEFQEALEDGRIDQDNYEYAIRNKYRGFTATKTRRILEVQSDLFQKGRDKKDLVNNESLQELEEKKKELENKLEKETLSILKGTIKIDLDRINSKINALKNKENQFLQLLNKNNNWVTFFVKSIIQDSAKKGYEKVLFPKGDTAAKIEGHQTLEEFRKQKEDRIKELENNLYYVNVSTSTKVNRTGFKTREEAENFAKENNSIVEKSTQDEYEINRLKQELADVESGQTQLSSIANFYENTVTNILKKNGYNPVEITDEYGNKWNEIILTKAEQSKTILLSPETVENNDRTIQDAEIADIVTESLKDSIYIPGLPFAYQERFVDIIISMSITQANKNKERGIKVNENIYKRTVSTMTTVKREFAKTLAIAYKNYKDDIKLLEALEVLYKKEGNFNKVPENLRTREVIAKTLASTDPASTIKKLKKVKNFNIEISDKVVDNFDKLFRFSNHKLKAHSILASSNDIDEFADEETGNIRTNYAADWFFTIDTRNNLTTKVKTALMSIPNGVIVGEDYNEKTGKFEPRFQASTFFGLDEIVPFDQLYNEVLSILAISTANFENARINQHKKKFDAYMEALSMHVEDKPYLHFLIEKLKNLSQEDKNGFVTNMSKSAINHVTTYMSNITKRDSVTDEKREVISLINKATNANETADKLLANWEAGFLNSSLVTIDREQNVKVNAEEVLKYENKAKALIAKVKKHKLDAFNSLKAGKTLTIGQEAKAREQSRIADESIIKEVQEMFSDLGFDLNATTIRHLYRRGYKSKKTIIGFDNLLNDDGILGAVLNKLRDKNTKEVYNFNNKTSSLLSDGYIKSFAKFVTRYQTQQYASSYSNGEGKNIFGYNLNKFLSDRVQQLKTDKQLLKNLKEDAFRGTHNLLLDSIYNYDTDEIRTTEDSNFFNYFTFDTNNMLGNRYISKALNKVSKAGYEQIKLNLFQNRGNGVNNKAKYIEVGGVRKAYTTRYARMLAPTFSDSKLAMGLDTVVYSVNDDNGDIKPDNVLYDLIIQEVVMPEYERIRANQIDDRSINKKNYKEAANLFYFIPELNNINNKLWDIEKGATGKITRTLKDIEIDSEAKAAMRNVVVAHVDKLVEKTLKEWEEYHIKQANSNNLRFIDGEYREAFDNNAKRLAYEVEMNYLISNANFFKLFAGDPADYYKGLKEDKIYSTEGTTNHDGTTTYKYDGVETNELNEVKYHEGIEKKIKASIDSTFDNIGKRLASQIAPGTDIISDDKDEKVRWAVVEDIEKSDITKEGYKVSANKDYYEDLLGKKGAAKYRKMAGTDAMGYSTMEEFLKIQFKAGNISKNEMNQLLLLESKKVLNDDNIEKFKKLLSKTMLNSLKPVYFNHYKDVNGFRSLYIKQSMLPLSRHLTKGKDLDRLREAMIEGKVDQVVFASAVKVGQPSKLLSIFDTNGSIKEGLSFQDKENNDLSAIITSPRQGHKIQLDNKFGKTKKTDGSQQRKLLFTDLLNVGGFRLPNHKESFTGAQLKREFDRLYEELYFNKYNEFVKEIGYDRKTGKIDLEKLQEVLKREFAERNYPLNDLQSIGLIDNKHGVKVFKQPLWTSTIASKMEALLVSMVDNNLRKHKIKGSSFILSSNIGFKPKNYLDGKDAEKFIKENEGSILFDKEWFDRGDFILKGQGTERDKNGKITKVTPAEIMLPLVYTDKKGNTINLQKIAKDGFIDTDKVPKELLEMFGYRIPTQGQNSMSYMKVVGFLSELHNGTVLAPSEFTAQMGSDFDIDKLYIHYSNTIYNEDSGFSRIAKGESLDAEIKENENIANNDKWEEKQRIKARRRVEELKRQKIENELLDIKLAVLSSTNEEVQKKILTPLDDNEFENLAKIIDTAYTNDNEVFSPISQRRFRDKYMSGSTGNEAIGVFANASTLHSLLQVAANEEPFRLMKVKDGKITDEHYSFSLGASRNLEGELVYRTNRSLSSSLIEGGNPKTKSQILSDLITLAVDNENLQVLGKLNINSDTYDFVVGAVMSGFNEELVTYFINQPIIRRYVELSTKVKDSSIKTYKSQNRFEDLFKEFGGYIKREVKDKKVVYEIDTKAISKDTENSKFTTSDLLDNILNKDTLIPKEKTSDFHKQQTIILHKFIMLSKKFGEIKKLQDTLNPDGSNGLGKDVQYLNKKADQLRDIDTIAINQPSRLLGEFIDIPKDTSQEELDEYYNNGYVLYSENASAYTLLKPKGVTGAISAYAVLEGSRFYSENTLFPYNHPAISNLVDRIYEYFKTDNFANSTVQEMELRKKALNEVKQYLYSEFYSAFFDGDIQGERKRLLIDDNTPSLASIINEIRKEHPKLIMNNGLLSRLDAFDGNDYNIGKLEFDAGTELVSMQFISEALLKLLEDNTVYYEKGNIKYTGKSLALDLVRHQFLTGGVQFRKQFIKYIPFEIIEAFGIDYKIRNFDLDKLHNPDIIEKFITQFIQNNSDYAVSLDRSEVIDDSDITDNLGEYIYVDKKFEDGEDDTFVTAFIGTHEGLFKLVEELKDGTRKYKLIPFAGQDNFNEYVYSENVNRSIIPFNNLKHKMEALRNSHNKRELDRLLKNDVAAFVFDSEDNMKNNNGSISTYSFRAFENLLANHKRPHLIKIIAKKNNEGETIIEDMGRFKGVLKISDPKVKFANDIEEGVHYERVAKEEEEGEDVEKTPKKITDTMLFEDLLGKGSTTDKLYNLLSKLKEHNGDRAYKYMYDKLESLIPYLVENNPNMAIRLYNKNIKSNGSVSSNGDGQVIGINLKPSLIHTLNRTNTNSQDANIHNTVLEELLHVVTLTAKRTNPSLRIELDNIREEFINNLNEEQKEEFKVVKSNMEEYKAIHSLVYPSDNIATVGDFKNHLQNNTQLRHTKTYQKIQDMLKGLEDNTVIDLTNQKSQWLKEAAPTQAQKDFYYPLINVDEFIAHAFVNPEFQNALNLNEGKGKDSLMQKLIKVIVRFIQRLSNHKSKTWERLFRNGIKEESLLEDVVAKSLELINYPSTLSKEDLKTIKNEFAKKRLSVDSINEVFNLTKDGVYYPVQNIKEVASVIKDTFDNINVLIKDDKYIVVSNKNESVDLSLLNFADIDEMGVRSSIENKFNNEILDTEINALKSKLHKLEKGEEIKVGSVVDYKGKKALVKKITPKGKLSLIDTEGNAIKGNPAKENVKVVGSFPVVKYGKVDYIVSTKGNIYSTTAKTGSTSLIYNGNDNTSKHHMKNVYNRVVNPSQYNDEGEINENSLFSVETSEKEDTREGIEIKQKRIAALYKSRVSKLKEQMNLALAIDDRERYKFLNTILEKLTESGKEIAKLDDLETLLELGKRDMLEVAEMLNSDVLNVSDVIYLNSVINNWSNALDLYFSANEQDIYSPLIEEFSNVIIEAGKLKKIMQSKLREVFEEGYKARNGKDIDFIEEFNNFEDVNVSQQEFMDISRINSPFFSYIHQRNLDAFNATKRETYDETQKVRKLLDKAIPHFKKYEGKYGLFDIIWQRYSDGTLTGNRVNPFSKDFTDDKKRILSLLNVNGLEDRKANAKKVNDWLKNNTVYFNAALLFHGEDSAERQKHISELKNLLGDKLFKYFYEQQEELINAYQQNKDEELRSILSKYELESENDLQLIPEAYNRFAVWQAENSPSVHYEQVMNKKYKNVTLMGENGNPDKTITVFNRGFEYLVNVPKKKSEDGSKEYYDRNFATILKDDNIFEFYKEYVKVFDKLSKFLPEKIKNDIRYGGMPEIEKTFFEATSGTGMAGMFNHIYDGFKSSFRTETMSNVNMADDTVTSDQTYRSLSFGLFTNNEAELERYVEMKSIEHESKTGITPTSTKRAEFEKEFRNISAERKSKDVGKLLNAYAGLALTYKHKSRIQDTILAGQLMLNGLQEPKKTDDGKFSLNKYMDKQFKDASVAYPRLKEMYDHYVQTFFDNPYKVQRVTDVKILTSEEKKYKKDLEASRDRFDVLLTELDYEKEKNTTARREYLESRIERIDAILEELGGNLTGSKAGDNVLKMFQLKGMGWNLLAGIGNLGFGIASNLVESADGRIITRKEMLDGMRLTMNSIRRNITFNKYKGNDGVAVKIRSIMDRNDYLKEASHELYANSVKSTTMRKFRFLSPYNIQKRTEYINQAPIMIAFYKKTFHTLEDGSKVSLWEAYSKEGTWNAEKYGQEPTQLINNVSAKITQFVKRVHGNYDPTSPMKIKQGILGRALIQFRSWITEGIAQRWGSYDYDEILETDFKGRYRTVPTYFKEMGAIGGTLDLLKAVLLNMIGKTHSYQNGSLTELDAANMRKLTSELSMYISMLAFYAAMSLAFRGGDDDEDEQYALNLLLNTSNKLTGEMSMYINPVEAVQMAKNPAPSMSIIQDSANLIKGFWSVIFGGDEIETGIYKGESRFIRGVSGFVPGLSTLKSHKSNAKQEYDNDGILNYILDKIKE